LARAQVRALALVLVSARVLLQEPAPVL